MKSFLLGALFLGLLLKIGAAENLKRNVIEEIFRQEAQKVPYLPNVSFLIDAGDSSYAHLPDLYIVPGSVIKLIIVALYLEMYGVNQKFTTSLFSKNNSTYQLFFEGDPNLKEDDVIALLNHIPLEDKQLTIEIATSMSAFPEQSPEWMMEDMPSSYVGPISPYQLNDGRLKFKIKTIEKEGHVSPLAEMPVSFPYEYVGSGEQYLEASWIEEGGPKLQFHGALPLVDHAFESSISVLSSRGYLERLIHQWASSKGYDVKVIFLPKKISAPDGKKIAIHESIDLKNLLKESLASSNNAFYDLLFFKIAQEGVKEEFMTWDLAADEVKQKLKKFIPAIDWNSWNIRDGAGVLFKNSMRGKDLMIFLKWIQQTQWWPLWQEILPRPGFGTMKRKFISLQNHLMGKSGLLSGVEVFAGFLYCDAHKESSSEVIFWPVVLAVNHGFDPIFRKFIWHESLLKNIVDRAMNFEIK